MKKKYHVKIMLGIVQIVKILCVVKERLIYGVYRIYWLYIYKDLVKLVASVIESHQWIGLINNDDNNDNK